MTTPPPPPRPPRGGASIATWIKGTAPVRALGRRVVAALDERERRGARAAVAARGGQVWALSQLRLLQTLPEQEVLALAPEALVQAYPRRHSVVLEEADARVWLLLSGGAKLCRVGLAGSRLVEAILAPGDVFGRVSSGAERASYEVQTLEPTRVAALDRGRFESLMRRYPDLAYCVVQVLEDRQRRLVRRLEALAFKDVRARVAETLLELTGEHGEPCAHGFAVDVRITQQDLAELVGASRQMVNRVLGELSRALYVQQMGRVICVLDRDRLGRLAAETVAAGSG